MATPASFFLSLALGALSAATREPAVLSPARPLAALAPVLAPPLAGGAVLSASEPEPAAEKRSVLELRPTQMALGMREVEHRVKKMREMQPRELEAYLRHEDQRVPVVIGPGGERYIVDHHHHARAAWEVGIEKLPIEVRADLSDLSSAAFWARMRDSGWLYPYDQLGHGPHDPALLPENVKGMADDPYRSLAWKVRREGGYDKTSVPYAEFRWANFFRERLRTFPTRDDFDAAVTEALRLASTPAARDLPGYKGP